MRDPLNGDGGAAPLMSGPRTPNRMRQTPQASKATRREAGEAKPEASPAAPGGGWPQLAGAPYQEVS